MSTALQMRAYQLPPGDAGVVKTINKMESLVSGPEGVGSPLLHQIVRDAIRGSVRDYTEIDYWFHWVKEHIQFRGEAEETLQSPEVTLKLRAGDCDDMSMLIAAGLRSLGYETAFKTVATPDSMGEYAHVYALALDKKTHKWIALDPTVDESYPGWEPDDTTREQTFSRIGGLMAYGKGNFRTPSAVPPQPRMNLGFYRPGNFRGLGYVRRAGFRGLGDDSGIDLAAALSTQGLQELPSIIGSVTGVQTSTTTAAGSTQTGANFQNLLAGSSLAGASSSSLFWVFAFIIVGGLIYVGGKR